MDMTRLNMILWEVPGHYEIVILGNTGTCQLTTVDIDHENEKVYLS